MSASNPRSEAPRRTGDSARPRRPLSRRRKWLYRLAVAVVAPVLFFLLLEVGLRLGGYGYPTAFLIGPDAGGAYRSNPQFAWRFFPRALARTPVPCLLSAKPAGAVRIFVLGGSAAQGIPEPAFSVGRILEVLLRTRYPDVKFEVVNAAMTAINSHVAVEIARDCAAHQPDLFIVYMGNNEVIGPYGPGTVFQQWSPSRRLIRANLWLKSTRVGQLLGDAMGWFRSSKGSPTTWQGLEMFTGNEIAADDPRLPPVYENFRQNLVDICNVARRAGAGVVLSTVAVNLRDCPPLASKHRSDLSADDLTKWKTLYQDGIELEKQGKRQEAIAKYEAAAKIDDRFAELPFRQGRCLAALGRSAEAAQQYSLARDVDALRFRAHSRINAIVREVAAEQKDAGVRLADAERSLAKSDLAAGGIPGDGLFYEHVHFTFDGNYLLARAFLEEVEAALPQLASAAKQEPPLSRDQCAELLALTPWDEYRIAKVMGDMTSRPPFTNQLDHAVRDASVQKSIARLAVSPQAMQAACETYKAAIEKTPDDCYLRDNLAKLELERGQPAAALEQLRIVQTKWAGDALVYNDLGAAAEGCGQIDLAIDYYRKAIELDGGFAMAHNNLGAMLKRRGQLEEAIAEYRKALECDPYQIMARNNLGDILANRGQFDEAVAEYRKALEIDPGCMAVHYNLANTLKNRGRVDEAVAEYRKALKIDPGCLAAHYNLANTLKNQGNADEAAIEYEKVLEIDPTSAPAHNGLGLILGSRRRFDDAAAHFKRALELKPDYAEARANLQKAVEMRERASRGQ
ncbi:MAG: tetratricopeptide repeat protein [Thermoguttaceae bacterium]